MYNIFTNMFLRLMIGHSIKAGTETYKLNFICKYLQIDQQVGGVQCHDVIWIVKE